MGISIRAYARARGVSDTAVRKAIKTGRISAQADGTIDPVQADVQWQGNTDPALQRKAAAPATAKVNPVTSPNSSLPPTAKPNATPVAPTSTAAGISPAGLATGGTSLLQARTANELLKAQTNKVRLARMKGELIERAQAIAQVFRLARTERDAWLNWPGRVSARMAADLNVDAHALHIALDAAVREHLAELGELRPNLD
ncbi:elements of external origin [Ottowia testudinis]|uniref:Elements of external origin n=1 Tax=Ottowia testudinis TaxID=2816950 RepID=A0A975H4X6_9BURK|nr:elements of external origin [Ottowia testudinis]QTD44372.1 elements of external origin [Ottowia testudinis]